MVSTEQVELFQQKNHTLGPFLVARFKAFQQKGQILRKRSEHFAIDGILQVHLCGGRLQRQSIVRMEQSVEVHDQGVPVEILIRKQVCQYRRNELKQKHITYSFY